MSTQLIDAQRQECKLVRSQTGWLLCLRQANCKNRAAFRAVAGDNPAALSLDKAFDNREAEAAASNWRGWRSTEFFENFGQKFRREARPVVSHT